MRYLNLQKPIDDMIPYLTNTSKNAMESNKDDNMNMIDQTNHPISIRLVYKFAIIIALIMLIMWSLVSISLSFINYYPEDDKVYLGGLAAVFFVIFVVFFILLLAWRARFEYRISYPNITINQGIFFRRLNEFNFSHLANVSLIQSFSDRVFNISTLIVEFKKDTPIKGVYYSDFLEKFMGTFLGFDYSHLLSPIVDHRRVILGGLNSKDATDIYQTLKR